VRLISGVIKNVANDVVPTICIFSLLVYKWHLDLMTSRKSFILATEKINEWLIKWPDLFTGVSYTCKSLMKLWSDYPWMKLNIYQRHGNVPLCLHSFHLRTFCLCFANNYFTKHYIKQLLHWYMLTKWLFAKNRQNVCGWSDCRSNDTLPWCR